MRSGLKHHLLQQDKEETRWGRIDNLSCPERHQATRCVYGIPSEQDISQEEAKAIAQAYIVTLGAQQSNVTSRPVPFAFDVTENPVFRVMPFGVEGTKEAWPDCMTYQVILDARAGEVLSCRNSAQDNTPSACNF